jgi:hypothetical protein
MLRSKLPRTSSEVALRSELCDLTHHFTKKGEVMGELIDAVVATLDLNLNERS